MEHYNKLTQKQIAMENKTSIKDLAEKVDILEKKIDRILFFFNSDNDTKSEGFIEKNNRHDREIKELSAKYRDIMVASGVVAFFVTGIIGILKWVLER